MVHFSCKSHFVKADFIVLNIRKINLKYNPLIRYAEYDPPVRCTFEKPRAPQNSIEKYEDQPLRKFFAQAINDKLTQQSYCLGGGEVLTRSR